MMRTAILATGFAALAAAAPLAPRSNPDNYFPANTVFGPFSAIQVFDPQSSYFNSCSYTNTKYDYVASIKTNDTTSDTASCGRFIKVTNSKNSKSVTVKIFDECLECAYDYLRLSQAAFDAIADSSSCNFTGTYVWTDTPKAAPSPATTLKSWAPEPAASTTSPKATASYTPAATSSAKAAAVTSSAKQADYTPTSSSKQQQAATSQYQAPAATSQYQAPKTTQQSSSSSSGSSSSSSGGWQYSGQATWFTQNGNAGACGSVHGDYDYVIALDSAMYGGGSHCGQRITIVNNQNGKQATGVVADECPTCASSGSLDLSLGLFSALGSLNDGVFSLSWKWA